MAVTQLEIARRVGLDVSSVNKILNRRPGPVFKKDTIKQVFKVARELGYLHPSLITSNRRESSRRKAEVTGRVQVMIGTNTVYDEGEIDIDEVSMSGMLLRNFRTKKKTLPMDRFKFNVEVDEGKLKGFKARCKLVRFSDNEDEFALAVKFDSLDEDAKDKLKNFVR